MDYEKKLASVLQADEFFCSRILSRQQAVGCSSRMYYRSSEGVPFEWEQQPGKPMNPPEEDVLPPLSPPPSVLSLTFPKPCIEEPKAPGRRMRRAWLWTKIKRKMEPNKALQITVDGIRVYDDSRRPKCSESDMGFEVSPSGSNLLSSSWSTKSSFHGHHSKHDDCKDLLKGPPATCCPRKISDIILCLVKRI
ncbi:hypothetical protein Nepgr_005827 [Nepenthes gracilis]|uniref:Uncharacterized protein n=1 Tax=Nepenthes gracilis TaxID=150966 RepID=A0AAD3XGU2_NEPGR|nr:hypothetical protein Nepgr_005827 [Nepenthes gracilis]